MNMTYHLVLTTSFGMGKRIKAIGPFPSKDAAFDRLGKLTPEQYEEQKDGSRWGWIRTDELEMDKDKNCVMLPP